MKVWRSLLIGVLVLVVVYSLSIAEPGAYKPHQGLVKAQLVQVKDGDTICVSINGSVKEVRYIGLDTPENNKKWTNKCYNPMQVEQPECYARQATQFNKERLKQEIVWLERGLKNKDTYGRLLRYVYLDPQGEVMLNKELLAQGYAILMTIQPNYKYREDFKGLANKAWKQGKGLWSACKEGGILSAHEARENLSQYEGKIVTVEYEVATLGQPEGMLFLNASRDYYYDFSALVHSDDVITDFPGLGIDLSALEGKVVRVMGKLERYEEGKYDKPEIIIEAPWQIKLIEGK